MGWGKLIFTVAGWGVGRFVLLLELLELLVFLEGFEEGAFGGALVALEAGEGVVGRGEGLVEENGGGVERRWRGLGSGRRALDDLEVGAVGNVLGVFLLGGGVGLFDGGLAVGVGAGGEGGLGHGAFEEFPGEEGEALGEEELEGVGGAEGIEE